MGKASRKKKPKSIEDYKLEGNEAFKSKKFTAAIKSYSLALDTIIDDPATTAVLRGNRSIAYIKAHEYALALEDCNYVLEELKIVERPKIWYRRALAMEGMLQETMNGKKQRKKKKQQPEELYREQRALLEGAQNDLQKCIDLDPEMKKTVDAVKKRLQKLQLPGDGAADEDLAPSKTFSVEIAARPDAPALEMQRQSILQLLEQRRGSCPETTLPDEAFFLIDWDWWCAFCHAVGLSDGDISALMPRGSVAPPPTPIRDYTLGEMDATKRLATERLVRVESSINDEDGLSLNDWLVRGHHYEVLPREVYATLVEWYSQRSPPIVRRASTSRNIRLYDDSAQYSVYCNPCAACGVPNSNKTCRLCKVRYCNKICQERHWKAGHKQNCQKETNPVEIQRVGLGNLGNTCFMNSALQALAHTTPLARYFLSGAFQNDINTTNPLGSGGKLAIAFETTIVGLRLPKPSSTSFSPVQLRRALAGSRFAGCQQHDAQEFLGYVLDGLHEDLNRIQSYDYVEVPDVDVDQCHAIAGARIWDAQTKRNDSLLWDTFYGQFKSTCVCPDCQRVSVSFDSFNHVSLEIPQQRARVRVEIFMVYPHRTMERLGFSLSQTSTIKDLKVEISSIVQFSELALCLVDNNDIATIYADSKLVAEASSTMFCYPILTKRPGHKLVLFHQSTEESIDAVGIPQMLSIPMETTTCRDLWEEVWLTVSRFADEDRSKLQIRVVNRNGAPVAVFPLDASEGEQNQVPEADANRENPQDAERPIEKTSILPSSDTNLITHYLSSSKYLFLRVEWLDESDLDEKVLCKFINHPTFKKMAEEHKAEKSHKITMENCLSTFTKPERLDDRNKWYCNQCKEHVPAMKTMELWRLPTILILHLKRFEFRGGFRREKLDMLVDFPLEGLVVPCSQNDKYDPTSLVDSRAPAVYDCFAVINHFGRMGFGHYTAFARQWDEQGMQDEWYLFDDSQARRVQSTSVVSPAAYVVFYRRRV